MLIPLPAMPAQTGPASPYLKSMRGWMMAMLVFQTVMCGCRLVMFLDIMGGFIMAIGTGVGWYAWKEDMHITYICYWGFFCLFNGALDTVKWLDGAVKSPMPLFSRSAPLMYNAMSALALMIPLSVLLGAPLAWNMYKNQDSSVASSQSGSMDSYGNLGQRPPSKNAFGNQKAWKTFSGNGQKLGTV
mmetsp:Transcript_59847/g.104664  ORF Transcript_59847/g.104664 Transcript_59847/m.104664 type:complete len:187 (+) Transcript_59847:77-637(+)